MVFKKQTEATGEEEEERRGGGEEEEESTVARVNLLGLV